MNLSLRNRPVDVGRERAQFLVRRFGRELRVARVSSGLSQRAVAALARVSQGFVSRIERGVGWLSVDAAARLAAAVGGEVGLGFYPGRGIGLRDSGQLRVAELIRAHLPTGSRTAYEVPVGDGTDRRAADMLVELLDEAVLIEIERLIVDYQAQYRAAQLKRAALSARLGKPVRLVWVIRDTPRNRKSVAEHADLLKTAFPLSSRQAWAALADGRPLGTDALIWLRERDRRLPGAVTQRESEASRAP